MELKGKPIDMEADTSIVIINEKDAEELGTHALDRVNLDRDGEHTIAVVDTTKKMVKEGEIGLTKSLHKWKGSIDVSIASKPDSVEYIKKKMDGKEWNSEEIRKIIEDINKNALSDIEMGAYVTTIYTKGMSFREMADLTESMVDAGEIIKWGYDKIADKHSIGGVPGNRVTPIIIPIIAEKGIKIPKTSSRAITSPSGTADTMEAICDIDFSLDEIKKIVEDTDGCLVWGGSVKLSPVDDKIIRAEHPLSLDPEGQVVASVLSKKKAAGSNKVVIDIPYGEGAKVGNIDEARSLAIDFKEIGDHMEIDVECTITRGEQPIGRGIGPVLEIRDCLRVLNGEGPADLRKKSVRLANILLEMCDREPNAEELLDNGKALKKFQEIVERQNGIKTVSESDLELGTYKKEVKAGRKGVINHIENKTIAEIGSRTGAPKDKGAGLYLHKKKGDRVEKGEVLMTVYAEKEEKLEKVVQQLEENNGYRIMDENEMIIEGI